MNRLHIILINKAVRYAVVAVPTLSFAAYQYIQHQQSKLTLQSPTTYFPRPLPPSTGTARLYENEASFSSGDLSIDLNFLPSNNPFEDNFCLHTINNTVESDPQNNILLLGLFDGHGGPECSNVVSKRIASYVARSLKTKSDASEALVEAFESLDNDIVFGLKEQLDVNNLIQAEAMLRTAVAGACGLVALVQGNDVFVAVAGDSRAVLGLKENGTWRVLNETNDHTTTNSTERQRILSQHPGEESTVIRRERILGGLQPTRAFGDSRYKWPLETHSLISKFVYEFKKRLVPANYISPPYVTASPVVQHWNLSEFDLQKNECALIMATDGIWDEISSVEALEALKENGRNNATKVIKRAMGNEMEELLAIAPGRKSRLVRDDMTVLVVWLDNTGNHHKGRSNVTEADENAVVNAQVSALNQ